MKRFFGMAFCTITAEFVFMNIFVAACAILMIDILKYLEFISFPDFGLMAFGAVNRFMFPYQGIFCFCMVE
jgi:hypothetical protein